jgi:formylglycine-generating enzyme
MTKLLASLVLLALSSCTVSTTTQAYHDGSVAGSDEGVTVAGMSSVTRGGSSSVGGAAPAAGGTSTSSTTSATGGATTTASEAGGTDASTGGSNATGGTVVTAAGGATPSATGGAAPASGGSAVAGSSNVAGTPGAIQSPAMVTLGSYQIDVTEVTRGQYDSWLATNPVPNQPAECSWNTSLAPRCQAADKDPNRPVICVNWCDAYAFCAAVGKHLCGAIGGGATLPGSLNTLSDEWFNACTSGGVNTYATGTSLSASGSGCVTTVNSLQEKPVGASACTSTVLGYTGIYDLSGNVQEWTNTCDPTTDSCVYRGGSYSSPTWTCATNAYAKRTAQYNSVGFRCCK